MSAALPSLAKNQDEADALVDEAFDDAVFRDEDTQTIRVLKLFLAMYAITGDMKFPRGWKRAVMTRFRKAGFHVPTPSSLGWYRGQLTRDPEEHRSASPDFEDEIIQELFDDLVEDALA